MSTFSHPYDNSYGLRPRWLVRLAIDGAWKLEPLREMGAGAVAYDDRAFRENERRKADIQNLGLLPQIRFCPIVPAPHLHPLKD